MIWRAGCHDRSLSSTQPFNDSQDETMFTGEIDALLTFWYAIDTFGSVARADMRQM